MGIETLSKQEKRVVHLTANGDGAKQIASKLYISVHTAQTHLKNVRRKLKANNIADVTRIYILSLPKPTDVLKVMLFMVIQLNIMIHAFDIDLRRPTRTQVRTNKTLRNRHGS